MSNPFGKSERFDAVIGDHEPVNPWGITVGLDDTDIWLSVQRTPEGKPVLVVQTTDGSPIAVLPAGANSIGIIGVP